MAFNGNFFFPFSKANKKKSPNVSRSEVPCGSLGMISNSSFIFFYY